MSLLDEELREALARTRRATLTDQQQQQLGRHVARQVTLARGSLLEEGANPDAVDEAIIQVLVGALREAQARIVERRVRAELEESP